MNRFKVAIAITLGITSVGVLQARAAEIEPTDLDSLRLGGTIVGPVGPEVDTTFVNTSGNGVGALSSSVSCPREIDDCIPPENPAGTVYTYIHEVTPGVEFPNDAPFPAPATFRPFERVETFRLNFPAAGFNGVAGYSFSQADDATGEEMILVETAPDGGLVWTIPAEVEWEPEETITFFWQTTQAPSGPNGSYGLMGDGRMSGAVGPLPTPLGR